ncbi:SET domain-containing protein [Hypoxylon sp. FL1284]|nr:SET domain-containing protein [Hypoxylon sp. FL1284]
MMLLFLLLSQLSLVLAYQTQVRQEAQTCAVPKPLLGLPVRVCVPSEAPHVAHDGPSSEAQSPLKAWKPSGFCRGVRAEKFCVFTNPTFNHGEGISIITTGASIAKIATRSAFIPGESEQGDQSSSDPAPPYREVELEGKGIGLVTTRTIRAGELVMARTPGIMVNEHAIKVLGRKAMSELLVRAVDDLPQQHRAALLSLSSHSRAIDAGDLIFKILETNSFRTGYHDGVNPFYSLFAEVSRANHDCKPSCTYYFDHNNFFQKVLSVRDIAVGEELSIAYYDPLQTHAARQEKLQKEWGFKCSCERCSANASSIAESDDRVKQIQRLWKELDDHSTASKATPEKAELLISLYEREGILGRLHEAYYRAATEYIGIGDIDNAKKYAKLCVDSGVLFIGPDRPFVKSMQDLIADPTKHPKWKFRSKDI